MALDLMLGSSSRNSFFPFAYCFKISVELQRLGSPILSFRKGVGPGRLRVERKLFDRITERVSLTLDSNCSENTKKPEVGIEDRSDISEIEPPDGVLGGDCINGAQDLGVYAESVMDRRGAIDVMSLCTKEGRLELGQMCHALVIKTGLCCDEFVATTLVNMYAKCGEIENANILFNRMLKPDIASCNCLISGYARNGLCDEAFDFFIKILNAGFRPNHYTYSIMLTVCSAVLAVLEGRQLHVHIVKMGYLSETPVTNALLTMYIKCGMMEAAESLFESLGERNLVSWTAVILGFYHNKAFVKALQQLSLMREHGMEPNEYSFTIALSSCGSMKHRGHGRSFHGQVIKKGLILDVFVGTAVIDMYCELGEMGDAHKQLHEMGAIASNVSWNALIAGFVNNDKAEEALDAFHKMVKNETQCDEFTYSLTLKACSSLPSLETCRQIHCRIIKAEFERNLHVGSSLIEVYAKCGNLRDAEQIFCQMSAPDVVSWNSMIKAYAQYGHPKKAILLFRNMVEGGRRPTSSTFTAVLSACSHSRLVQEGQKFFESMVGGYCIPPEEPHYSCMVDLLGRSGQLKKALDFINNLPIEPTAPIWRPLLASCRFHHNLPLAEVVAKQILDIDPKDATVYVTLSNMYAEVGRKEDAEKQRLLMELNGVAKEPGCSWMEVNKRTYKFFSGDRTYPELPKLYEKLKQVMEHTEYIGNSPIKTLALEPETGHVNDEKMSCHSEKLAVCFGLINLPVGTPVRIFKNLRVCWDCHASIKCISKFTQRDIILRDNYRFHHFKQGSCSCGDFW